MNHIKIAKLNVHHLGCKHGFLSTQYSKLPIKNLAKCIFRANCQIFDSPIIPHIRYTHYLPTQSFYCALLQYADDLTLIRVVPSKDDRIVAAEEMNADLARIYSCGQMWNVNFESAKCHSLCVSLKRDITLHPLLFMATLPIEKIDVLKILGIYFDRKLAWSYMIDHLTTHCHQQLGALFRVRECCNNKS